MAEKRQSYDAEFREGAVRIVTETGKTIAQVAADLGIKETTLGSWVARARRAGGDGTLGELEREELVRLRRESVENRKRIKEVEMERDVFKRAMALWVKRPRTNRRRWSPSSVAREPSTTCPIGCPVACSG